MKKNIKTLIILLFITCNVFAQVPTIHSFSPVTAHPGAEIILSGSNFSNSLTGNKVYFGAVSAMVTAATAGSLTVTVPFGATYAPLSVTTDSLTGYSAIPFIPSFNNGGTNGFATNSMAQPIQITGGAMPCIADFDNDGKPDMATWAPNNKILVYKNESTQSSFSFVAPATPITSSKPSCIIATDLTGDGKLDIAIGFEGSSNIAIFKNISTNENILFAAPDYFATASGTFVYSIAAGDIDGNGKTDLVVGYGSSGSAFSVLRNTGITGNIAFVRTNHAFGVVPGGSGNVGNSSKVVILDIDGDGKPDVTSLSRFFPPFLMYRNTSTPGTVSFAAKVAITSNRNTSIGNGFFDYKMGDIDGDGKPEIIYASSDSMLVSVYRNTSTAGNISYGSKINFDASGNWPPNELAIADLNGDGRTDIAILAYDITGILINNSTSANVQLSAINYYNAGNGMQTLSIADIDADGKSDIITSSSATNQFGTLINKTFVLGNKHNGPVINAVIPITADAGTEVTIYGDRFTHSTMVSFGGAPATSFTVLSDTVIKAVVGNGANGDVSVTTAIGITKFPGFTFLPPIHVIHSFEPATGAVGSMVVIKGKNFSDTAANNIVFFGSGLAEVTVSTDTSITVIVPANSSYMPISVTIPNRRLTAYAATPFRTIFNSYMPAFSAANFSDTIVLPTFANPIGLATADFNGDKKTDIVASVYWNVNRASVFTNTGTNEGLGFAPRKEYVTYGGSFGPSSGNVTRTIVADLNGDGKPDMPFVTATGDYFAAFTNSSNADSMSFISTISYATGADPTTLSSADFDGDGRPDIAITISTEGKIAVLPNTTISDSIAFAPRKDFICGPAPQQITIADFDGDGKPDMAVPNYNSNTLSLFRNTSTRGAISFADTITLHTSNAPQRIATADLDADGRADLLVINGGTAKSLSIYKNSSSMGAISFEEKIEYAMPDYPRGITIADLDGDAKPDVIVGSIGFPNTISLFKNNSTAGNISMLPKVDIPRAGFVTDVYTSDVTGDGKPDIIASTENKTLIVFRNVIGDAVSINTCPFTDSISFASNVPGNSFQWQENTGSGFVSIPNNSNYNGVATQRLLLNNVPSTWQGRQYRCVVNDSLFSDIFEINVTARWLGTISNEWENPANWSCGQLPDENTAVQVTSGSPVINSIVVVRSMALKPGANITVNTGFALEIRNE